MLLKESSDAPHVGLHIGSLPLSLGCTIAHVHIVVEEAVIQAPDEQQHLQPQYAVWVPLASTAATWDQVVVVLLRFGYAWTAQQVLKYVLRVEMHRSVPALSIRVQELDDHDGFSDVRSLGIDESLDH